MFEYRESYEKQLLLEKFSPELIYMKGPKKTVADAFSRLDKIDNLNNTTVNYGS